MMKSQMAPAVPGNRIRWLAGVSLLVLVSPLNGQQLTVERLFETSEFAVEELAGLQWASDGERFTYVEYNPDTGATDLWAEEVDGGDPTRIVDGSVLVPPGGSSSITIEDYAFSPDQSKLLIFTDTRRVWRDNTLGTYYVYELDTGRVTPISRQPGGQMFAKFSPGGERVGFVRENDLFVTDLTSGEEWRLTDDGSDTIINGTFDWVYEEELGLQDGWRWSPDGRRIAFWQLDQSAIDPFYMIDERDLYNRPIPIRYPKAGTDNSTAGIGVIELASGHIAWLALDRAADGYLARMDWASSDEIVVQALNRQQNRIEVLLADAATGATRFLFADSDEAWLDVDDDLRFLADGAQIIWSSERDGHNHLYLYNRDGSLAHQITRGDWDVDELYGVDESDERVYFSATAAGPLERQLYRIRLDGSDLERLSEAPGTHSATFAPDYDHYIDRHSMAGEAPTTALHRARGHQLRVLVDNGHVRQRLATAGALLPEFFAFETGDGVELNGWIIKPPGFDGSTRHPVLMYVYGGPGSQTVTDAWWGDRYLWHQLLAERGYLVVSVDNRGTGGRGAGFKKQVYLNLGKLESSDQVEAARYLSTLPYVDPDRIGLWGWSYGGYMTLLTMGRGGDLFKAGIAVAPVTDWSLYDTIYTERFMRTPAENPDGYRKSAPLAYAEGIEGELLLVHGTHDDNVHFQNAARMVDRLVDVGKQFDFMMYPNRTHSLTQDEARPHLWRLLTDFVVESL